MKVNLYAEQTELPQINRKELTEWIEKTADLHGRKVGEISYIFCDDAKILEVNRQYLDHDYYTDIITFDYTQGKKIAGDLFISLDTVKSNADEMSISYDEELKRIIIHGILHLCGFKDKSLDERKEMTQLEDEALAIYSKIALLNESK